MTVNEENKKMLKYIGVIFILVLITYKLPHKSYSIIEYIMPTISTKNAIQPTSSIIVFIIFIIGIRGLCSLKIFEYRNKFLVFLLVVIIIMPLMKFGLDITRTNYHWIKGDKLKSVDIEESHITTSQFNEELKIILNISLIDYGKGLNQFKIKVYLPKSLAEYVGQDSYELKNIYRTRGDRNSIQITEEIDIILDNYNLGNMSRGSRWYKEKYEYELYNDKESIRIINNGL